MRRGERGRVIGMRRLHDLDSPRRGVTVVVHLPRRAGEDWVCPYSIDGLAGPKPPAAFGGDALQALTSALRAIDVLLDKSGRRLAWFKEGPAWNGFDKLVPLVPPFHDRGLRRRLDRFLDRETGRIVRRLLARRRARRKSGGRRHADQPASPAAARNRRIVVARPSGPGP
jgi:hypothetical protein